MECTGIEAATWVWKLLWKRDTTHIKFDILDAVLREGTSITGWIFTATDGSVKSKANFRWNAASIIERCTKDDMKTISGHEYLLRGWRAVEIDELDFTHKKAPAMVLMGRINNPSFFIEQTYTLEPGEMLAKHVTNRLCPDNIKGTGTLPAIGSQAAPVSEDLPTHRLRNKDKKLNKLAEAKMKEFVHLIESRSRLVIRKVTAVFLVETARHAYDTSGGSMMLWLHHASFVHADRRVGSDASVKERTSVKGGWDNRSETSATIAPTSINGHLRGGTMRCAGDFCGFVEEEEAVLHSTDEGSVAEEARLALRRHRRLTQDEEGGSALRSPGGGDTEDEKATLHRPYGTGVLIGSQAFKVPQKHIVLVRNDMAQLEQLVDSDLMDPHLTDRVPWPELVQHWWWRIGKAVMEGKSKRVIIPESSSHQICGSIFDPDASRPSAQTQEKEVDVGINPRARIARIASGLNDPAPDQLVGTGKLTAENLDRLENKEGDIASPEKRSVDPFRSASSKETNSKMGDLSWYYSEANVCERCYHVYRDIQRKRKLTVKERATKSVVNPYDTMYSTLPNQAKEALKLVPLTERDRYLEARKQNFIRRQKSNSDRLAQAKTDSVQSEESQYDMDMSTLGPHDSTSYHRKKYTSPAGAPKGVIPPTPWNLNDESVRSEYAEMGSAFIKGIRNKAQTISMQVQEGNKLKEMERLMGIEDTTELDDKFKWKAMTGQAKGPRKNKFSREEELPPNPLHKSMSADNVRRKKKPQKEAKVVTRQFDSSRLMHQWQRDMESARVQRRQEDVIWKDDLELNNRLQKLQSTGIVQGVVPVKKKKAKKQARTSQFEAPTVPPNSILNQKATTQDRPSMDQVFRSTGTLPEAELGLTRKNSLHTIEEDDDEVGAPSTPPLYMSSRDRGSEPKSSNQHKSPVRGQHTQTASHNSTVESKPPLSRAPIPPIQDSGGGKDDDGDDDEDDDEGIGWSPFVVPLG